MRPVRFIRTGSGGLAWQRGVVDFIRQADKVAGRSRGERVYENLSRALYLFYRERQAG